MKRARAFIWCAALGVAVMAASPALGAERLVSVSELSREAEVVARAEVVSVTGAMVETAGGRFPFLVYEARVKEVIAGACPARIFVRVPGVVAGGRIGSLPDGPALGQGTEAVFFLKAGRGAAPGSGIYDLVSLGCGALPVAAGGKDAVVMVPEKGKAHEGRGRVKVRLQDLTAQVKAARENQAREAKP
ncbi:MAG TPA: hypothetical protein VM658_02260 [bacterium]|nr:hypothetical protein [bacterium]